MDFHYFFFTGIILTIFEIDIFRDTIIDCEIPTCIMILAGLIFTPFMSKHLVNYYDTTALFLQLIINIMSFGGIFVYLFMATNYYIVKDTKTESIKTKILNTGYLGKGRSGGCESPYAEVKIKKSRKQLIFSCSTEIEQYEYVDLILQEGYLGYDIIISQIPRTE